MAHVLRLPGVSANETEATLAEWIAEVGADFAADDVLATVETDKAAVDIEAEGAGVLLATLVPPGALVEVGAPMGVLGAPGEQVTDLDALLAELGVEPVAQAVLPERRDVPTDPGSAAPLAEEPPAVVPGPQRSGTRVFSSPLARKLASRAGLSIDRIEGSGPRGRVLRRDVDAAIEQQSADQQSGSASGRSLADDPAEEPKPLAGRVSLSVPEPRPAAGYDDTPHSRLRRAVAGRLVDSKREAPHFYLRASLRADRLVALRAELNAGTSSRVSLNDLLIKVVAVAHERVPEMNVMWTTDAVRAFRSVDIAVAVATDRGLLTPVVRDVGSLTVTALAERTADLAARARTGELKQDELEGGSISVTNLGMYGVEDFSAIINPPQSAILAVGAVREAPVIEEGQVVVGQVLGVTLSVDHRPVDGVVAARWLAAFKELIENPVRILA